MAGFQAPTTGWFSAPADTIASKEVAVEQFQSFWREQHGADFEYLRQCSPGPGGPQISVSWFQAAEYCNWLSRKQGIPEGQWCYVPNGSGKFASGMRLANDWQERTGYRLPTDAEWEYACRAGALTSRYYGRSEDLLPEYGWHVLTSPDRTSSCGRLKPNDWGLFDMHGNVWEWCADWWAADYYAQSPPSDPPGPVAGSLRVFRGGSWGARPGLCRSAYRSDDAPGYRFSNLGFRLAFVPADE